MAFFTKETLLTTYAYIYLVMEKHGLLDEQMDDNNYVEALKLRGRTLYKNRFLRKQAMAEANKKAAQKKVRELSDELKVLREAKASSCQAEDVRAAAIKQREKQLEQQLVRATEKQPLIEVVTVKVAGLPAYQSWQLSFGDQTTVADMQKKVREEFGVSGVKAYLLDSRQLDVEKEEGSFLKDLVKEPAVVTLLLEPAVRAEVEMSFEYLEKVLQYLEDSKFRDGQQVVKKSGETFRLKKRGIPTDPSNEYIAGAAATRYWIHSEDGSSEGHIREIDMEKTAKLRKYIMACPIFLK